MSKKLARPVFQGVFTLVLIVFANASFLLAQTPVDLSVKFDRGDFHQVAVQFEHKGVVIVDHAGQDDDAQVLPLDVIAKLKYAQRFTGAKGDLQAIRFFEGSGADIEIDEGETDSKLSETNRLIVARINPNSKQRLQMASISDVLDQRELELIRNPADPLSFTRMFRRADAKVGDKWKVKAEYIADFLAVDHVFENNLEIVLKSLTDGIAKLYVVGSVKAEVDDVTTDLEISSIALINVKDHYLKTLRTTIREDRSPGQVAPGFKGQTKIDLKMTPTAGKIELSNEALSRANSKKIERRLKWETDEGDFRVIYDPRWRIIASESEATVMRFLDQGQLLAQCNIVQLDRRPPNNPLKLAQFKKEIEKIIEAEDSAEVVKAQELKTRNKLRALRLVVDGIEDRIPIKWIYYHVAHDDGRRLTFVFTLEQSVASQFDIADKLLVNETTFKPGKTPKNETAKSEKSSSDSAPEARSSRKSDANAAEKKR